MKKFNVPTQEIILGVNCANKRLIIEKYSITDTRRATIGVFRWLSLTSSSGITLSVLECFRRTHGSNDIL